MIANIRPILLLVLFVLPAGTADAADPADLFAPVELGGELAPGWELSGLEAAGDALVVRLDPGGLAPALTVRLTRKDDNTGAFCRTPSFNIVFLSSSGEGAKTPEEIQRAMDALCGLVEQNDRGQIELQRFGGPASTPPHLVWRWPGWPSLLVFLLLGVLVWAVLSLEPARRAAAWAGAAVERRAFLVLLILLIPAAWLRLMHLDIPFDADYMTQRLFFGSLDIGDILLHRYEDQRHPQLFYLILHFFLYFGHSEWIARLPAVLFSLGSAVALFVLARPYLGGVRSLLCVVLLMLSTSYFQHSRDVTDITLFVMLALLACHLFLRCLKEPRLSLLIAFAAVETAMFYTYYMAVLVALAQILALLVFARSRRFLGLWIALGAAFLMAFFSFRDLALLMLEDMGARRVASQFPAHMWGEKAGAQILSEFAALLIPMAVFGVLTPLLALVGLYRWGRRSFKQPVFLLLVVLMVVSLVVIGLAVALVRLRPYYLLFLLPPFMLFVVVGCLGLPDREGPGRGNRVIRAAGWVVLGLVVFVHANDFAWRAPRIISAEGRGHFRKVGEVIRNQGGPDTVAADPDMLHTILVYYCFPQPLLMYRNCEHSGHPVRCEFGSRRFVSLTDMPRMQAGWEQEALERLRDIEGRPFWFVYTDRFPNAPLLEHLRRNCEPRGEWAPLALYRCRGEAKVDPGDGRG